MFALDLFNNDHERRLAEGAVDQLEQRRIDDLAMKMDDLVARAKNPAYKKNPAALAALMKEFQKCKAERDSYYKVRNETMGYGGLVGEAGIPGNVPAEKIPGKEDLLKGKGRTYYEGDVTPVKGGIRHHAKPGNYGGYEPEADPLARLDKHAVNRADKAMGVKFDREKKYQGGLDLEVDEAGIPGSVPAEKIPGKEDLLKGKGRSYYEAQKKNLDLSKGVIPTEPLPEHGGGIGPKQHWQDLMPEQSNPDEDDWYDDEEDQETDLRSGDYVRDTMDGESGEIFRMQGDPYERRVRILDRDGKGWYIEPSRLTRVDPQDPEVQRYFGKKRQRDMDEAIVASGPSKPLDDRAVRKLVWDTMKINADSGEQAIQRALSVLAKKPQSRMVQDLQDKFQNLADRLAQGVAEGWSDAIVAQRTGQPRTPYSVYIKGNKWKDFENEDHAEAVANKLRAKFKADGRDPETITIAPTDYDQPIKEEQDTSGVERAILNRIMTAHTDLLMKFGPEKVMQAAEEVAYNVGDVDEIGTSDVSAYVAQVKQILGVPEELDEKWSQKYKSSINCANPKGFSQKAHCAGKKK